MPEIAFLNGEFMPIEEAKVPVDDRGYQFGDGVYEVIESYKGRLWALERHLNRLRRSLSEIGISGITVDEIRERILEIHKKSGISRALVYVQVTRGVAPRRHAWMEVSLKPTLLITVREFEPVPEDLREKGIRTITLPEMRWGRRDIKSINLLPNVLAAQRAWEAGAYEAIFVDNGYITEGAHNNIFAVRDGRLFTPQEGPHILSGITRGLVIEMAKEEGIPVEEGPLSYEALLEADEVFLTGTGVEVLGVVSVDGRRIGSGEVGPMTRRLYEMFMDRVERGMDSP
ncbi:MAG: amino acid aminotransferase [Candidatus Latescibacterota bacterium]|nr:MAG: amino acid aminotransferase [Candidatus Latescibacterota bacterium]